MKLRNKKTGEILVSEYQMCIRVNTKAEEEYIYAASIAELNEEWEDYKPAEPLIKDEKIRKAVRAWAEACDIVSCYLECGEFCTRHREIDCYIGFGESVSEIPLEEKQHYTIAELCGEAEE